MRSSQALLHILLHALLFNLFQSQRHSYGENIVVDVFDCGEDDIFVTLAVEEAIASKQDPYGTLPGSFQNLCPMTVA